VLPNSTGSTRSGYLTIAGKTFTITQQSGGGGCTYSLSPASNTFAPGAGSGSVNITAGPDCSWTASTNSGSWDWIAISSGWNGTGNGTVNYFVLANNTGNSRTGTLAIAGQTFTITQQPMSTSTTSLQFSAPTAITNPYFPLASLDKQVLERTIEAGDEVQILHIERTLKDCTEKLDVNGQKVRMLVVEDRSFVNGELVEVALGYFAQADDGAVYSFGEDVDVYSGGVIVSNAGTWRYGVNANAPVLVMPANPQGGMTFSIQNVAGIVQQVDDEVVSVSETVTVPAGTFTNCLKVKEILSDGTVQFKYYAPNMGVVKIVTPDGDINLITTSGS
jgi:hypothetical protein